MTEEKKVKNNDIIDTMFKAGAHFGYQKSRRDASTTSFIFGTKNKVEIIDLEKTNKQLEKAKEFVTSLAKLGKQILFVGGKSEAKVDLKIGDPENTFTTPNTYVISYNVSNAYSYFKDFDEIYWNTTGNDWPFPILNTSDTPPWSTKGVGFPAVMRDSDGKLKMWFSGFSTQTSKYQIGYAEQIK